MSYKMITTIQKMALSLFWVFIVIVFHGCASTTEMAENDSERGVVQEIAGAGMGFVVDREVAKEKAAAPKSDGKEPDIKDVDAYLDYIGSINTGRSETEGKIKKFMAVHPNEKRGVFMMAVHYLKGNKKEMASFLFKGLEKEKDFPWKSMVYNNLGMLALQEKNRPVAIEYLEKAVKASPATAAAFVNLGALYLQSRNYTEAQKMFARAVDLDDEFEDAALGLGASLEGQGKFEEAHNTYAAFIADNADALAVLYNDSLVLGNRLKQKEVAAQMMTRYLQRGGKETARAHENLQSWR